NDFVIGGHEIREVRSFDEAWRMHAENRAIDPELLLKCKAQMDEADKRIKTGTLVNVGSTIEHLAGAAVRRRSECPRSAIERVQSDMKSFVSEQRLAHLIVVNVASTEPAFVPKSLPDRWSQLDKLLDKPRGCPLPASSFYAIAALDLG